MLERNQIVQLHYMRQFPGVITKLWTSFCNMVRQHVLPCVLNACICFSVNAVGGDTSEARRQTMEAEGREEGNTRAGIRSNGVRGITLYSQVGQQCFS